MPHKDPEARRAYARDLARRRRAAQARDRAAARAAAVAQRLVWPVEDLAWAAGMFEGEGTVSILTGGRAEYARCIVSLTSTDIEIVNFFQARWPASKLIARPRHMGHRQAWVWMLSGDKVVGFIEDIQPHLRTSLEREKFSTVLECQRLRWTPKTPEREQRMIELRDHIRLLNRRGQPQEPEQG